MFIEVQRINADGLTEPVLVNLDHVEAIRPSPKYHLKFSKIHFMPRNSRSMQWAEALPTVYDVEERYEDLRARIIGRP